MTVKDGGFFREILTTLLNKPGRGLAVLSQAYLCLRIIFMPAKMG
jgi:hypothetical protein